MENVAVTTEIATSAKRGSSFSLERDVRKQNHTQKDPLNFLRGSFLNGGK